MPVAEAAEAITAPSRKKINARYRCVLGAIEEELEDELIADVVDAQLPVEGK